MLSEDSRKKARQREGFIVFQVMESAAHHLRAELRITREDNKDIYKPLKGVSASLEMNSGDHIPLWLFAVAMEVKSQTL